MGEFRSPENPARSLGVAAAARWPDDGPTSMNSRERILVIGVDYSDFCIPAVDEALRLSAGAPGARLIPLLALPGGPTTSPPSAAAESAELVERSKENLVRLVDVRARALGIALPPITPAVRFGAPAECLLSEAREHHATHIVVGTRGRRGMSHLLLGSVAEEVTRNAECSVLVARSPHSNPAFSTDLTSEPPVTEPQRAGEEDEDTQELPRSVWEAGSSVEGNGDGPPPAALVLSEPHVESGRVVLPVLDRASGQAFIVSFDDMSTVRVDPLEGDWVPAPSSSARARAARAATEEAARSPEAFERLFAEIRSKGE